MAEACGEATTRSNRHYIAVSVEWATKAHASYRKASRHIGFEV